MFQSVLAAHPTPEAAAALGPDNIHRTALSVAQLLADIPPDPRHNLAPDPIAVGSYPLRPDTCRDLDFEVHGLSWEHLQQELALRAGEFSALFLTKGLPDGRIPQDRASEGYGGNAFVAAWITLHNGTHVNVSIPLRVSERASRYDLSSVERDPLMSFADASQRRSFAHKALGYRPLSGEKLDPHEGERLYREGKLKILHPPSFVRDPLNLYTAIVEMGEHRLRAEAHSEEVLRAMAARPMAWSEAQLSPERLRHERMRLLQTAVWPSVTLEHARFLGVFERDMPELLLIPGTQSASAGERGLWQRTLQEVDSAWHTGRGETNWTAEERAALMLARLGYAIVQCSETSTDGMSAAASFFARFAAEDSCVARRAAESLGALLREA